MNNVSRKSITMNNEHNQEVEVDSNMTMNEGLDKLLIQKEAYTSKENVRYYKGKIPSIREFIGEYLIEDVTEDVITEFVTGLKKRNPKISNHTIKKYRDIVVAVIRKQTGKVLNLERIKVIPKEIQTVSDRNVAKIFTYFRENMDFAYNYKYYLIIKLLLETGVRINELVHIKVKNIDTEMCSVWLEKTKVGIKRTVYFKDDTNDYLLHYISKYVGDKTYLFPSEEGDGHIKRDTIYKYLKRLQKRLGIEQSISAHKYRHTFSSKFYDRSRNLPILQTLLGHTELNTTRNYIHYSKKAIKREYDKYMR